MQNPSLDERLAHNDELFSQLKGESTEDTPNYAPLVEVDQHAVQAEVSTEDYFEKVRDRVGSLGHAGLQLVHSEMDDAWHIIVAPIEATI